MMHPNGYNTTMITLSRMRDLHEPKMHPEFSRRFFAYMEHKGFGVGGGFRTTQPVKPGFAEPGKSFHEAQTFASGLSAYCAVDLVVAVPGGKHRAPTWAECADAPDFGLHTFVKNEPWHIQPFEIRGWQTWVNAGRPDPQPFTLPNDPGETDMPLVAYIAKPPTGRTGNPPWMICVDGAVRYATNEDATAVQRHVVLNDEQYDHLLRCANLT